MIMFEMNLSRTLGHWFRVKTKSWGDKIMARRKIASAIVSERCPDC
jgi:hypothetical protein